MVDIEQARFRLHDDVANSILLHHVIDPDHVAGLVGQRDMDNPPAPELIAREIVEDLTPALAEFEAVAAA